MTVDCIANYCGGCNADFYDLDGKVELKNDMDQITQITQNPNLEEVLHRLRQPSFHL